MLELIPADGYGADLHRHERRNRHCSQFDELEEIRAGIASALAAAEAHRDNYDDALADEHNRLVAQEMSRLHLVAAA